MTSMGLWFLGAFMDAGWSTEIDADPSNYTNKIDALAPGDTLRLAPGTYTDLLYIVGLNGTPDAWITITGPEKGEPAKVVADPRVCCNTVEIIDSSYVAIRHLTIDGDFIDGPSGISAKDGLVHHIRVENNDFPHYGTSQSNVVISTKVTTWGWEIRGNRIVEPGTGIYLGDSDGSAPFIGGIIENNLIVDPIGYDMEIKFQTGRDGVEGMPTDPQRTIIRHNTFIKDDRASDSGDRPNVLVGGFPDSGLGADDRYEIYGNLFYGNPREALLQASGRVSVHDNLFVSALKGLALQDHDLPLRTAKVYNNTFVATETGISISGDLDQGSWLVGNLVFADRPVSGSFDVEEGNVTGDVDDAPSYLTAPGTTLGSIDLYPLVGMATGAALDLSPFADDTDHGLDFNCNDKGDLTFRGAYAGEGENPGWVLQEDIPSCTGDHLAPSAPTRLVIL